MSSSAASPETTFSPALFPHLSQIAGSVTGGKPIKWSRDAQQLGAEFLRLFVLEAIDRSVHEQQQASDLRHSAMKPLDAVDLEKCLAQLLLDF